MITQIAQTYQKNVGRLTLQDAGTQAPKMQMYSQLMKGK